jgi:hypothetical protein
MAEVPKGIMNEPKNHHEYRWIKQKEWKHKKKKSIPY